MKAQCNRVLTFQTSRTNNKRVKRAFKFGYPQLTLKKGPKVKSEDSHISRFLGHGYLEVGCILQTCRTNNEQVISTFKFGSILLTLKKGPKVKFDIICSPAHDFLLVGFTLQTSKTNNKCLISTFKFSYPELTLKKGDQGQICPHQKIPSL